MYKRITAARNHQLQVCDPQENLCAHVMKGSIILLRAWDEDEVTTFYGLNICVSPKFIF